jgi:hypothetical protein
MQGEALMSRSGSAEARYVRHLAAVARSFALADAAAERGEYTEALAWLRAVLAIGDEIPAEYQVKRRVWQRALLGGT